MLFALCFYPVVNNKTVLLLPIWLLTISYGGKPFQTFINGATGEVHGDYPWSKVKIAAMVIAALVVIAVLVALFAG